MFKLDSPLMNFLNKVCDVMILNLLVIAFSLPIVTAGSAITAAYYVSYRMVRNEEGYIVKMFWKAFKENFKQSTIMWLIMLLVAFILYGDYKIVTSGTIEMQGWMITALVTVAVIIAMGMEFVFPMQARFSNTVKNTMRNAFLMALSHLPSAVLFLLGYAVPLLLLYLLPQLAPAIVLLIFGALPYFKAFLYLKIFKKYEEKILERMAAEQGELEAENEEDGDSGIFAVSEAMEKESENN